jgi:hypothetical protein
VPDLPPDTCRGPALAGRAPIPAALPDLPASSHAALSRLADVFRAPAGQAPT